MSDEREDVKPLDSGEVEVSVEGVEWTPRAIEVEPETPPFAPAPEAVITAPKKRGRVDRSTMSPDELKAHKTAIEQKHKQKTKAKGFIYDSKDEPTKPAGKELIEQRGVKHPHVIDTVYRLLLRAAEDNGIAANRFLFRNGLQAALASYKAKEAKPAELISTDNIPGELLTRAELYALYDTSISTHEEITFEQFLDIRLRCKSDTFYLGKEVFQNDFAACHETWRDFFPQWNPTTLPANYTQRQAIDWLASQSDLKDYLLLASRRAFKSSFARLWLVTAIITLPDIRVLIVSETRPLSKDNIEAVRGYFETTPGFETKFQRLFPEFQIPVGDGSVMSLEVPMRRLKLPQSVESSSMDSTVAGRRADLILFDDCISEVSCTNEEQIKKSVNKRDLLVKLKERGGYVVSLGTPYADKDLYFEMIERSKKNADETFAYRVDPAFQVKPEARHKLTIALLPTLVEDDIESFLFPEGLPWKELRTDMRNNPGFFMSQNLCIFPLAEDEGLKVQFGADELRARTKGSGFFGVHPTALTVMSMDRAFTANRYSDFSCLVVGSVQPVEGKMALVFKDCRMERWRESDLVRNAVEMIEKHKPSVFIAEQDRGWETLADAIRRGCQTRGIPVPYFRWKVIQPTERLKAKRIKAMELPLSDGRLWFYLSSWTESLLLQFEKYDGTTKSNNTRKDDGPDACSLLWQEFGPKYEQEIQPEENKQNEEQTEKEAAQARRNHFNQLMFGPQYTPPPKLEEAPQPVRPEDPRMRIFGNRGPWRL